ncbi:efflux RND transporter periplasmic adaptor subunit [Helicobacter burdigaliensis]|uniref:efflux RND transporter periplasmic adaptor subunit n=1 Tax=Helicobacter burdigaliensis TaxID=2315334 RepID=UPI000EF71BE9|nr:transporter [Helicobacter burdigaliensis]
MRIVLLILVFLPLFAGENKEIYATFSVVAVKSSVLSLSSSGVVENIFSDVGEMHKKGDKLLNLKNGDLLQNLKSAKAAMDSLSKKYEFSKRQFLRYEKSKEAIDLNTYERIKAEHESLFYELKRAEANYKLQKELYDKTFLYAPYAGRITYKYIEIGEGVGAISTKLFSYESLEKKAMIEFDSKYFTQVKKGDKFYYKFEGQEGAKPLVINKIYPAIIGKKAIVEARFLDSIPSGIFGDGFIREK